ncbi:hypothetical protein SAMN04489742_2300 [Arthrobacter crystallopoietes]|uniref:Uncharacterized protein n=1 Tax=Crystallibacter crystallopoietes TaxID=37928 RepID=A0A1H1D9C3_9MICC|nr:hypothetical protein SAMN04489742_2300 [Arthrobacter crystallopoietes]
MLVTAIITVVSKKVAPGAQGFLQIPSKESTIQRDAPLQERHGKPQLIA